MSAPYLPNRWPSICARLLRASSRSRAEHEKGSGRARCDHDAVLTIDDVDDVEPFFVVVGVDHQDVLRLVFDTLENGDELQHGHAESETSLPSEGERIGFVPMNRPNRRTRRALAKQPQHNRAAPDDDELCCSCGWPLPFVRLAFDDPANKPSFAELKTILRGVSVLLDCPQCDRVHEDPMGVPDEDEASGPHEKPIRSIM
jgi:hypothetical protein